MDVCFFRYAWIAPDSLEDLTRVGHGIEQLSKHLLDGTALAQAVPVSALRAGAIARLSDFASNPRVAALPSRRLLRSAARWAATQGEQEAARLTAWCSTLLREWSEGDEGAADVRDNLTFLENLAATDFPTLLLWSNAGFARRLFVSRSGRVAIAPAIAARPRALRQAVVAALRYALGAFGRFGPRDAWVGSGFAVADGGEEPALLDRRDERIIIEPDIGWFARHWWPRAEAGVVPGEDGWSHVVRRLRAEHTADSRLRLVRRLRSRVLALGDGVWSFADVDAFLASSAADIAETVDANDWLTDPHRWWLARVVGKELRLRASLPQICKQLYAKARSEFAATIAASARRPAGTGVEPFPARVARTDGATVVGVGEEFVDWVMCAQALRAAAPPYLPVHGMPGAAIIVRAEGVDGRYELHEPNPRRIADSVARHFATPPRYLACDAKVVAIAPPSSIADQRLLRPSGREIELDRVPERQNAMFRFALAGPRVRGHVARELASPRYARAPDLLPLAFDRAAAEALTFGRIDPVNRVWVLYPDDARALATQLGTAPRVAFFYRLEVHARLGFPRWIGTLVDGRASRMPTSSALWFHALLRACRTAASPIVVHARRCDAIPALLTDAGGRALSCEIYAVKLRRDAARGAGVSVGAHRRVNRART